MRHLIRVMRKHDLTNILLALPINMMTIRRIVIGITVQRKSDNEIDWLAQDSDCSDGLREQGTRSPIELSWDS